MVQGLQVYDGNGQIVVDVTDNLTSVIDIFNTGTSNGSKQLPSGGLSVLVRCGGRIRI